MTWVLVSSCPDPYDISPNAPASTSYYNTITWFPLQSTEFVTIPYIEVTRWSDSFVIIADIEQVIQRHGPGVYTVVMFDGDVIIGEAVAFME